MLVPEQRQSPGITIPGPEVTGFYDVELLCRGSVVRLNKKEFWAMMRMTSGPASMAILVSDEFRGLSSAVRRVVKDWVFYTLGR